MSDLLIIVFTISNLQRHTSVGIYRVFNLKVDR